MKLNKQESLLAVGDVRLTSTLTLVCQYRARRDSSHQFIKNDVVTYSATGSEKRAEEEATRQKERELKGKRQKMMQASNDRFLHPMHV